MPNFYSLIGATGARLPDTPAIEMFANGRVAETTTYAALLERAERVAGWLVEQRQLAPGDRVALLSANSAAWVAAYLGILHAGGVAVPLDTAYSPAQVATIVKDCQARVVFVSERLERTAVLAVGDTPDIHRARLDHDFPAREGRTAPLALEESAPAAILYTSGTTADPKGVVLTHANLHAERDSALATIRVDERDSVLGVLPLFHALAEMANLLLPLSAGSRVVFLDTIDSASLMAALQARPITVFACVPQFFYLIHQRVMGEIDRSGAVRRIAARSLMSLNGWLRDRLRINIGRWVFRRVHRALGPHMRYLITGGSRFDPSIARELHALGLSLLNGYGLTETSGAATVVRPGDRFTTSVGQPLPGVEIRIADARIDDDTPEPAGEILIRGGIVTSGYFNRPAATAASLDEGWLRTGDLGYLDRDGRLFITGREKDVIVLASGKNLYPEEIEAHYRQSPFIQEICVLGLSRPDAPAAERLHAVVVPDEHALTARGVVNVRELIRFELEELAVRLPPHKRVLGFDIAREPLPRTTTGKLRRAEIEKRVAVRRASDASQAGERRPRSEEEERWAADSRRSDLVAAVAAHLNRDDVLPHDNLELDLGLDSMERVELLTALESRAGTEVAAGRRATIFTVQQLVDALMETAADGAAADDEVRDAHAAWSRVLSQPPDPSIVDQLSRPTLARAIVIRTSLRMLGWLCRAVIAWRIEGRGHLPRTGPCVICPNHQSYLDGFFVVAALPLGAFRQLFLVGASEYFESAWMRRIAKAANILPVDPDTNLVSAMRAAAAGLALGKVLVLFPEGERTIDGEIKPFRKGAAILGAHLAVPLVPVAVSGLYSLWPRGRGFQWRQLRPWRRPRVTIAFGPALHVTGHDYAAASEELRRRVGGQEKQDKQDRA